MELELVILNKLVGKAERSDEFARKVLPFLQPEYFDDDAQRTTYQKIDEFFMKYNKCPTVQALAIDISKDTTIPEQTYDEIIEIVKTFAPSDVDYDWMVNSTEQFCKDKSIYNCIMESISIIDGKNKKFDIGAIPNLMQEALAVSFDTHVGHDYFEDVKHRLEYYHKAEHKIPTGIELLDKVTNGGFSRKTLNVFMGGTGVGKTLTLASIAATQVANNLQQGENVLYVTMEMSEEEIAKRVDANLLNIPMDELPVFGEKLYMDKMTRLKAKSTGRLIIKEFPTGGAHVGHFRHLVNELKMKKNFIPSIIYIDYLNICASIRHRHGSVGMYEYIKAIAEELRGFAVELDVPIVSATQTNREGFKSSDPGIGDTSESFGLPATCDWFGVLISSEQLEALGQMMLKQEKSRYGDVNYFKRFVVGVDKPHMRIFNLDPEAQHGITEMPGEQIVDAPVMDLTDFGKREADAVKDAKFGKSGKFRNLLT